ncbi:response regulator [Massilia sp. DWR3-1-1]|uniref:response regulator n=1 Tax=Massilia sp. DWR3-1-1 TaxID=2804559 RepID=UPI003CF15180
MPSRSDLLLLVEDNPDDEALILRAFELAKVAHPLVAHDGVEALECLSGCAPEALPRLVVLDLKLPRLDGMGVLKAIRADPRTRLIPVLMLTSSMLDDDLAACYALGANSYLVKPIDFSQFVAMVAQLTHYWLTLNQTAAAQGLA